MPDILLRGRARIAHAAGRSEPAITRWIRAGILAAWRKGPYVQSPVCPASVVEALIRRPARPVERTTTRRRAHDTTPVSMGDPDRAYRRGPNVLAVRRHHPRRPERRPLCVMDRRCRCALQRVDQRIALT